MIYAISDAEGFIDDKFYECPYEAIVSIGDDESKEVVACQPVGVLGKSDVSKVLEETKGVMQ